MHRSLTLCCTKGGFRIPSRFLVQNVIGMDQGNAIGIPNQIMETCFGENRMEIPTPQNKLYNNDVRIDFRQFILWVRDFDAVFTKHVSIIWL